MKRKEEEEGEGEEDKDEKKNRRLNKMQHWVPNVASGEKRVAGGALQCGAG